MVQDNNNWRAFGFSIGLYLKIMAFTPGFLLATAASNDQSAEQVILESYSQLQSLYATKDPTNPADFQAGMNELVSSVFDLDRLAPQLLPNNWAKLGKHEQQEFTEALIVSIRKKIEALMAEISASTFPAFNIVSRDVRENFTKIEGSIKSGKVDKRVSLFMLKKAGEDWKISNLKSGKQSLRQSYYKFCKKLMDKYSFRYLVGEMLDAGYIILEDFESSAVGSLPRGWTWRSNDDKKNKPYKIVDEDGNHFLAARDHGESVILGKDIEWNIKKYPYVSFRVRATSLPEGGDERYNRSVDSAAGIYFVYKKKFGLIPESVKYVWSTTLPVGAAMKRSGIGRPWMVVAESGEANLGEWRTYTFNLYEAYKKTFGGTPPDKPVGVGVLSDANSTKSKAYADYDDIRALKTANAGSGVEQIMEAE